MTSYTVSVDYLKFRGGGLDRGLERLIAGLAAEHGGRPCQRRDAEERWIRRLVFAFRTPAPSRRFATAIHAVRSRHIEEVAWRRGC